MSSKLNDIAVLYMAPGNTQPSSVVVTDVTHAGVNLATCDNNCFAIMNVGLVGGTETTFVGSLQEATTATGTYTNISGASFSTVTSTTGTHGIQVLNFQRTKQFVRFVGDITGTTATVSLAVIIGGQKKNY